jgi:hypothetical protein
MSVTLNELGLDNPTGYPNVNLSIPAQMSVTLNELGLDNPTGYPNVNPISPGVSVCDPERCGPRQPYWLPQI